MCNTWRNVFLQSMKNNTLSVKKLMKNLILRTLQQLYAVSEIIILIRWVSPPSKVEIPQLFKFFNFALSSLFPLFFFIGCIYIWVLVLYNIHLLLVLQAAFSAKWMWSDPSPSMLNSTRSVHKFFMCVLIWNSFKIFTVSLTAEEIANGKIKTYLI